MSSPNVMRTRFLIFLSRCRCRLRAARSRPQWHGRQLRRGHERRRHERRRGRRRHERQQRGRQQRGQSGAAGAGGSSIAGTGGGGGGGGSAGTGGNSVALPFPTQACIDRANGLLAMMMLDEKIAQTIQAEREQITNAQVMPDRRRLHLQPGRLGPEPEHSRRLGVDDRRLPGRVAREPPQDPDHLRARQRARPGPGRHAPPCSPTTSAWAPPRDAALVEEIARVTADESAGVGADFPFAPVIAVARDERWGRTYEAFGETPDLASTMGVAMVKGLQFPTRRNEDLDPRQPEALPRRRRNRERRDGRSGDGQRGGAARDSPRALPRRDRGARRLDHAVVQHLAGRRACTSTRR